MKFTQFNIQIANFKYSEILKFIENQSFPECWRETDFSKELRKKIQFILLLTTLQIEFTIFRDIKRLH